MFTSATLNVKQTRYLSQAIQLEEAVNPAIIRATLLAISMAIVAFLGWAALTNINEVARTPGEVMPESYQQVVQHLEGGIVRDILVREGQSVAKGQILLRLDGTDARDELSRARAKQIGLTMEEERLRALLNGHAPNFSRWQIADPAQVRDQLSFYRGMLDSRAQEQGVIQDQIAQKQKLLQSLQAAAGTAQKNHALTQDLFSRRDALNRKGYVSDIQLLQTQQTLNSAAGEMQDLSGKQALARAELAELQTRAQSLRARYREETNERLSQVLSDNNQTIQLVQQLSDRVARLEVRAPVGGLVKGLSVNTVGAVIQPGQMLMEIVPVDGKMIIQVKIPPQHIGHVRVGQTVAIKFSSFDFARYGVVTGHLERISPTTFNGENGERYYQGVIRLDRNYVGHDIGNAILPGMTVMAEIITGEKTVLDYLLKPIALARQTAFTER